MKKIELIMRKSLRKIFSGISLTAVAFVFQACYGPGPDCYNDIKYTGTVTSKTTNLPIKGIKIVVNDESNILAFTDENGNFEFYSHNCMGVTDRVSFIDIDGELNRCFANSTITINTRGKDQININVELEEKDCD